MLKLVFVYDKCIEKPVQRRALLNHEDYFLVSDPLSPNYFFSLYIDSRARGNNSVWILKRLAWCDKTRNPRQ